MLRHGKCATVGNIGHGLTQTHVGGVRLRGGGEIDGGVGEGNATFGHADEFECVMRIDGDAQRGRIGEAYIFAGEDHESTRNEARIFTGV